jgi:hypothetical protein
MNTFEQPRMDEPAPHKTSERMIKVAGAEEVEFADNPPYENPGPATPEDVGMIDVPEDAEQIEVKSADKAA